MRSSLLLLSGVALCVTTTPAQAGSPGFAGCMAMIPKLNRIAWASVAPVDSAATDAMAVQFGTMARDEARLAATDTVNADCRWHAKAKDAEKWQKAAIRGAAARHWSPYRMIWPHEQRAPS